MVIFATMLNGIRVSQSVTPEKFKELEEIIEEIKIAYVPDWNAEMKEKGVEIFLKQLDQKKEELRALCTDK